MSQIRAVQVVEGDTFGRLEDDDFLVTGNVSKVTDTHVEVDFGDWVQRYPRGAITEGYHFFKRLLCAGEVEGVLVADYRLGMAA
jgi:hypothetical protein